MPRLVRRLLAWLSGNRKLVLLAVWYATIKLLATVAYNSPHDSIYDISFGFGPFIESLLTNGHYRSCVDGSCTYATRMPGLPLFFAALGLISKNLLVAALLKTVIMTIGVFACFRYLLRRQPGATEVKAWVWFVVAGILACSPAVIKHATTVHYEEGFLIEILFLWVFALLLAARRIGGAKEEDSDPGIYVMIVVLGALAYLFKSSMIAVLVLSLVVAGVGFWRSRGRAIVVVGVLAVACVAGWGVHNQVVTHHFSVMTSFDGQNAYRGANDQGEKIYPQLYLDRLFDSEDVYLPDGERVALPHLPAISDFPNEWAQNSYYEKRAKDWTLDHPGDAARFDVKKAVNFLVGIHKTPYTYDADARNIPTTPGDALVMLWLAIGRVFELVLIGLLVVLWRRRDRAGRFMCAAVVLGNGAYAAPYLVGFNYERHVTTFLVMVAASVAVLLVELRGRSTDIVAAT